MTDLKLLWIIHFEKKNRFQTDSVSGKVWCNAVSHEIIETSRDNPHSELWSKITFSQSSRANIQLSNNIQISAPRLLYNVISGGYPVLTIIKASLIVLRSWEIFQHFRAINLSMSRRLWRIRMITMMMVMMQRWRHQCICIVTTDDQHCQSIISLYLLYWPGTQSPTSWSAW